MSEVKIVPELRFSEFSEAWSKKQVGELGNFFSGGTPTSTNKNLYEGNIPFIGSGKIGSDSVDQFITEDALNGSSAKLVETGDLLYALYGATSGEVAISKLNGAINQAVLCIRTQENKIFLKDWLIKNKPRILKTYLQGGQGNLSAKIVKNLKLCIPSKEEQQKIADFLSLVDKKIEQLTEKHRLLTDYKKGVMQQVFSQQIRFKDDNGNDYPEWDRKSIAKLGAIIGGGTPETTKAEYWNGDIQWFTPTEIKQKYMGFSVRSISNEGLKKSSAKILPKGTLLLTTRATIADIAISTRECATNQGFQSIVVNEENNNEFVYYWIIQNRKLFVRKASGSTFPEISKKEIEKIFGLFPCVEEQQKIANFLTEIDQKINQAWSILEQTKAFKKGLLQKMFV
ncbi:restriction endonuclease subunit S [Hydrogenovibrio crunogenus]|uniref:Restriction endonuclease subunit S n=1 Tax=Hydrogenovibrio crunogenus TaxID=39765 RepID=A0A4P7P0G0_9GAMM|nr:restriction endonuclease subunit S [Hydrogenovibrio crunogenus]QBZ83446.1 restriction endonuclease subunit S [Hydrogenovibrio crunogenus]